MTGAEDLATAGPAFHRPSSVAEACTLLATDGAVALAGGQDLVRRLHTGALRPRSIVSLDAVAELAAIEFVGHAGQPSDDRGNHGAREPALRIGAMATIGSVSADVHVRRHLPGPARTLGRIANVRVRAAATVGGNLARAHPWHHPPVILAALGATITVHGPRGTRRIDVDALATDAGSTVLGPGELIAAVEVPLPDQGATFGFCSLPEGHRDNLPIAHAAALVAPGGRSARVVVGAATPTIRVFEVNLRERQPDRATHPVTGPVSHLLTDTVIEPGSHPVDRKGAFPGAHLLAERVVDQLTFRGDGLVGADYRRHLTTVAVARALAQALAQAPARASANQPGGAR